MELRSIIFIVLAQLCWQQAQEVNGDPGVSTTLRTLQKCTDIFKTNSELKINATTQLTSSFNDTIATRAEESLTSDRIVNVTTQLMSSFKDKIAIRAEEILTSDLIVSQYDVSSLCLKHTKLILKGAVAGDKWALRMIDSMGKPPSGLLELNLMWPGNFDECVNTEVAIKDESGVTTYPFSTQYCLATFPIGVGLNRSSVPKIVVGMCVPRSCSNEDVGFLANNLLSLIPNTFISSTDIQPLPGICKSNGDLEYGGKEIFVIAISAIFLFVMILATFYDLYIVCYLNRDKEVLPSSQQQGNGYGSIAHCEAANCDITPLLNGKQTFYQNELSQKVAGISKQTTMESGQPRMMAKVLLAFSVYTNVRKLFDVSQSSGILTAVHGVRFISMLWVILGHTFAFAIDVTENFATFLPSLNKRLSFQAIANATVSVDTFFVLSGLLVAYLSLKEMRKRGGARQFKWGLYYFHRFWRLTPPYMFFLMLYVPLIKYWIKGPFAPEDGTEVNECSDSWWRNLLYINNLYDERANMCMNWSWYLANDMQFYILSPLMLIPLYYSPRLGAVSCFVFMAIGTITTGAISKHYEASSNYILGDRNGLFGRIYIKPWCRIAPYAAGIYTGYLLYKCDCKCKLSKLTNLVGWTIATAVALLVLYGLYDPDGESKLGVDMAALYNATSRLAWGLCICWVVFACATENGGPVNTLLSWRGLIPFSRLTYCAYLVHPVVMYVCYYNRRTLLYATDLELVYLFLGHACLSYAAAFVISLAFESPMMGLEKVLLGRK